MKKLLLALTLLTFNILFYTAQPKVTPPVKGTITKFKPVIPTILIHNQGDKLFTLNSISFLFSINGKSETETVTYKTEIEPSKIKKITNTKITFNLPETTQLDNLGINSISINNNQTITLKNPINADIYLTNKNNVWQEEIGQPSTTTAKAKTITTKIMPAAKNTPPAAKTSTLKSAAVAINKKTRTILPQSKTAKAVENSITKQKTVVTTPKTA
ncbi:hypothetical protein HYV10_00305 [Candidatus Dependentiae bacterium]|nr:hypothetical protein [Candidatus Dependentiae bacterium]